MKVDFTLKMYEKYLESSINGEREDQFLVKLYQVK
jgi:hypothetical protein